MGIVDIWVCLGIILGMEFADYEIHADDRDLNEHLFKEYRSTNVRRAERYKPGRNAPKEMALDTPWGERLTVRKGDYIVSEIGESTDRWPVAADVFEDTYLEIKPGYYIKRATVQLAPLVEFTGDDPDALVAVHTMEGVVRVRSGDFYLARGTKGEIWPIPVEKVHESMVLVEESGKVNSKKQKRD